MLTDRITLLVLRRIPGVGVRGVRREIGRACGISQSAIHQWYSGITANIKNDHLIAIAQTFDTTVDWLLMGEGEPPRRQAVALPVSPVCTSDAWQSLAHAIDGMLGASILDAAEAAKKLAIAKQRFEQAASC